MFKMCHISKIKLCVYLKLKQQHKQVEVQIDVAREEDIFCQQMSYKLTCYLAICHGHRLNYTPGISKLHKKNDENTHTR